MCIIVNACIYAKLLCTLFFGVYTLGVTFTVADELYGEKKKREMNCLVDLKWDAENILLLFLFLFLSSIVFLQHLCLIQERMPWTAASQATCSLSAVIIVRSSKTAVITQMHIHFRSFRFVVCHVQHSCIASRCQIILWLCKSVHYRALFKSSL